MNIKIYLLAAIFIFAVGCRKDKTNWTSDWVIPIVNDSLLVKDYVNDSTLSVNPDQSLQVLMERELFNIDLTELIKIPDTTIEQSFSILFPAAELVPGYTFIDQIKENNFSFQDVTLKEARIKKGQIQIQIENPIPTKGIFTISLPGVVKSGQVFSHTQTVDGGTTADPGVGNLILDLSGHTIDMRGKNGDLYNLLQSKMTVKSDPEGPTVSITNQDKFKVKVKLEKLLIDYAKGYFGNILFSDTLTVNLSELNSIVGGAINVDSLNLDLVVVNGIKARAQGRISLFESTNYNNTTVGLNHPYFGQALNLNPAQDEWQWLRPSELIFAFNNNSGNLKSFIENLGNTYRVGYSIEINPYGNTSNGNDVLYPNSELKVMLKSDFPMLVGADGLTLQDTFAIDFKNDNKLLRVEAGKLILKTTNTFPYGAEVKLFLLNENKEVLKEIAAIGQVSPALTNASLSAHLPIENSMEFLVDEESAEALKETKYVMVRAKFSSTLLNNNVIYSNAALKLLLSGQLKLKASI
ncbi:MAG TPA: hypothetical protein VKY37_11815 [Brumimicrobium sp.]|nr:hypothetical protein [Brumimicrobium sp.]